MEKQIDPEQKDALLKIGKQIRKLRNDNTNLGYRTFADELNGKGIKISRNTLYRIETGGGDYNLLYLVSILKHFDVKLSDFFIDAGL